MNDYSVRNDGVLNRSYIGDERWFSMRHFMRHWEMQSRGNSVHCLHVLQRSSSAKFGRSTDRSFRRSWCAPGFRCRNVTWTF